MANYNVTIINGSGSQTMETGEYTVSAIYAPGYDMSTIAPATYPATSTSSTGEFTISASGTLSIIFNETGQEGGNPINFGSVVMTNSTGETQYGEVVKIDSIENTLKSVLQNFTLTDANYAGLPVYNAGLKFEGDDTGE